MANLSDNSRITKLAFTVEIPSLENENWVIVDGWQYYAVSNMGRLYSLRAGAFIKPQKAQKQTEHLKVRLSDRGKWLWIYIHRLVALNFIPNPLKKAYINHIDANPKNNCVDNLEWATPRENAQHSYSMGLQVMPTNRSKGTHGKRRLKPESIIEIKKMLLNPLLTYTDIGRRFNISGSAIKNIHTGKSWGYINIPSLIESGIAIKSTP